MQSAIEMQNNFQNRMMFAEKGYLKASLWIQSYLESRFAYLNWMILLFVVMRKVRYTPDTRRACCWLVFDPDTT